ncbi:hypothetical protein GYB22_11370 [bacterium]|nr:hypothetical protein [bacterium]
MAVKHGISSIDDDRIKKYNEILVDTTMEIRDLSHSLMPKSVSKSGLKLGLADLFERSQEIHNINIAYRYDLEISLAPDIQLNLFRIVQELLQNAEKHSKCTEINCQIYSVETMIILIFEDNGIGISESNSEGIGLISIASRVETMNGKLSIESNENQGTIIRIKFSIE